MEEIFSKLSNGLYDAATTCTSNRNGTTAPTLEPAPTAMNTVNDHLHKYSSNQLER